MKKRPESNLKNKGSETVLKEEHTVYLTENGANSKAVMSMAEYVNTMSDEEYQEYVENALDEADKEAEDPNTVYYTQEEMDERVRRYLRD